MHKGFSLRRALPWLALLAVYALSITYFGLYGAHNLTADDSSEMVLAAQLNAEGKLMTDEWLYSTELRMISPVPLYQLGLLLFPNSWHAARTFAVAVVSLIIMASVLFAMRQLGLRRSAIWIAAVSVMPFSSSYAYIMVYSCYYAMHMALSYILLGLLARFGRNGWKRGKGSLLASAAIGLLGGLNGVRMLTMFIAPVFASAALLALCALKRHADFRAAAHEPSVRMAGAAGLTMLTAGAGYLVNMKVFSRLFSYLTYTDMEMGRFRLEDFLHQFDGIVEHFGYRGNVPLFTPQGVGCWVALLLVGSFALALLRLRARWGELDDAHRLLALTAVMAILLGMLLNVLLNQLMTRYFMIGMQLLVLTLAMAIETEPCPNETLRRLAMGAVVGCFLFQTNCTLRYDYIQGEAGYEMTADWLLEHDCTQGYATFWNANTITEASDGRIRMWVLEDGRQGDWTNLNLRDILQSKANLREEPEGKVFLLVDWNEAKTDTPLLDKAHFVETVGWTYDVYLYESVEEMRALIAGGQNEL